MPDISPTPPEVNSAIKMYPRVICIGNRRCVFYDQAQDVGKQEADHSSDGSQKRRFDQELQEYVAALRSHGFARSYLHRSFGNRNQHDIHDHDATDNQRNKSYGSNHHCDGSRNLADHILNRAAGEDVKIIFLVRLQLVARPEDLPDFVLSRFQRRSGGSPDLELNGLRNPYFFKNAV